MKLTHVSNINRVAQPWRAAAGLVACVALGAMLQSSARADMYRGSTNAPGGVQAASVITSTLITPTNATICWYGMQGWYDVETATNASGPWTSVGHQAATDFADSMTVPNTNYPTALFRLNQANAFVGSGGCAGCHGDKYDAWSHTAHSYCFTNSASMPAAAQKSCYPCHSVGYGQATGFVDPNTTPHLENVGCENCHGPAGWHKYSDHDLVRPAVSIDPKICGSCHTGSHHPTYDEYADTLHDQVNDDVKYGFNGGVYYSDTVVVAGKTLYGYYVTTNSDGTLKTNATTGIVNSSYGPANNPVYDQGQDRQVGCGMCHSGATRMAMLADYEARLAGTTNALSLPSGNDSGAWGPTCAVCHDPHSDYNTAQLRNPTRSTNYFTMATTADKRTVYTTNFTGAVTTNVVFYNTAFANLYDPNIQVCGQCHNTRGARWDGRAYGFITNGTSVAFGVTTNVTGYSRPPHHSPQYNVLIGIVQPDYLTTNAQGVATNYTARHSGFSSGTYNTNQCATCHMPSYAVDASTKVTGHTFELDTKGCALGGCHGSGVPDIGGTQANTTNNLSRLVDLLNQWGASNAPDILRTNWGPLAWEFTTPGALGNPSGSTAVTGPWSAVNAKAPASPTNNNVQISIPEAIRQARFNAYMVLHDGSMGVHNPGYLKLLLSDAETKVLSQFSGGAAFQADKPSAFVNTSVKFTNLNTAATNCTWNFGDGSSVTVSGTNVVYYKYANPGTNTVTLTTTDANGTTTTMTRNNYIIAYAPPVPSFTVTPTTGKAPLTVSFTNTSLNATYYRWTFMNGVTGSPYSNDDNPAAFTYTNAGTYQIRLTAYNPGGSVATTNIVTVTP